MTVESFFQSATPSPWPNETKVGELIDFNIRKVLEFVPTAKTKPGLSLLVNTLNSHYYKFLIQEHQLTLINIYSFWNCVWMIQWSLRFILHLHMPLLGCSISNKFWTLITLVSYLFFNKVFTVIMILQLIFSFYCIGHICQLFVLKIFTQLSNMLIFSLWSADLSEVCFEKQWFMEAGFSLQIEILFYIHPLYNSHF